MPRKKEQPPNRYSVVVAEDEIYALQALESLITADGRLELIKVARDGKDAARALLKYSPDVAILDIMLPGKSGLEVARSAPRGTAIIFATAYGSYAVSAFEAGTVDYLLKPYDGSRFRKAVDRALEKIGKLRKARQVARVERKLPGVIVRSEARRLFLPFSQIILVEALGKKVRIKTLQQGDIVACMLMKSLSNSLTEEFRRCHRKFIVNINYISHIEFHRPLKRALHLSDVERSVIPVGAKFAPDFL